MIRKINRPLFFSALAIVLVFGVFAFQVKNDKLFALAKNIDIFATLIREPEPTVAS